MQAQTTYIINKFEKPHQLST